MKLHPKSVCVGWFLFCFVVTVDVTIRDFIPTAKQHVGFGNSKFHYSRIGCARLAENPTSTLISRILHLDVTSMSFNLDWIRRESRYTAKTGLFTMRSADPRKQSPATSRSTTGIDSASSVTNRFNTVDGVNKECTQSIDLFASGFWEVTTQQMLSAISNCSSLFPLSPFEEKRGEKEWWTAEISDSILIRGNDQFTVT